jgi:hypothetical protein
MNRTTEGKNLMSPLRRVGVLLLAFFTLVGITLLSVAPANAAAITSNVSLRPCVDLANGNCAPVGTTATNGMRKMRCWRDGSWATGNYRSNRWFLVVLNDEREGYVHSSFVPRSSQTPEPNCGTLAAVRAADFVIGLIGQTYATTTVAADYAAGDWAPGPYAEWSGDCAKLTGSSFSRGARISYKLGNAIDQYGAYKRDGLIQGGIPRYGDPVFYSTAMPWGHTAIYIGGKTVVSTQGLDGAKLPVARRDLNSFANYLGWALL